MTDAVAPTDLLGSWTLSRLVEDHLAAERRHVVGTATLELVSADRVRWREQGTMSWAGHCVEVGRTLQIQRTGRSWEVRFEDGRPFHPWSVGARVEHPCGLDHYSGLIETDGSPVRSWQVEWQVSGPQKHYRMTTTHSERRAPDPPRGATQELRAT